MFELICVCCDKVFIINLSGWRNPPICDKCLLEKEKKIIGT